MIAKRIAMIDDYTYFRHTYSKVAAPSPTPSGAYRYISTAPSPYKYL